MRPTPAPAKASYRSNSLNWITCCRASPGAAPKCPNSAAESALEALAKPNSKPTAAKSTAVFATLRSKSKTSAEFAPSSVSGAQAAIWIPNDTEWLYTNLNVWLDQKFPSTGLSWTLVEAMGITDTGLVTGRGLFNGQPRGFVLDVSSLLPEPGIGMVVALIGIAWGFRKRRN